MADFNVSVEPENAGCFSLLAGMVLLGVIINALIDSIGNYP